MLVRLFLQPVVVGAGCRSGARDQGREIWRVGFRFLRDGHGGSSVVVSSLFVKKRKSRRRGWIEISI